MAGIRGSCSIHTQAHKAHPAGRFVQFKAQKHESIERGERSEVYGRKRRGEGPTMFFSVMEMFP